MCTGERPMGAAKGKQTNTMALCQPPPARASTASSKHDDPEGMFARRALAPFFPPKFSHPNLGLTVMCPWGALSGSPPYAQRAQNPQLASH